VFQYPRALRAKKLKGFTALEILIATLILSVALGAVFFTFSTGELSFQVTREKVQLQSRLRAAMGWVMKDLHQAISWNVADPVNLPGVSHLKFNTWVWDNGAGTWALSTDYVEYTYDAVNKRLRRSFVPAIGSAATIDFNDIAEPPFYTTYIGPNNPANQLDADQLRNSRVLIVVIRGQKAVRGTLTVPFSLISEVKIRNG
jgi:prepilin-type N-terminal cleavage/methylation domain-containing protein